MRPTSSQQALFMQTDRSVSTHWVQAILRTAEKSGISEAEVLAACELPEDLLADKPRIALRDVIPIWRTAQELSGNPHFGLHMGEQVRPGYFNVLAYLLMNSPTLKDALAQCMRFQRLISEGGSLTYRIEGEFTYLVYAPSEDEGLFSHHQIEAVMVCMLCFSRWLAGVEFSALEASFTHSAPEDISEHQRIFNCPLQFDAPQNQFKISTDLLQQPLPDADPSLFQIHEQQANQKLGQFSAGDYSERIKSLLQQRLSSGGFDRESIARELATSPRNLQRKLQAEDTSYNELLDAVRRTQAVSLLADSDYSLTEIALLLGFTETSAFHRAFKRWFQQTPSEYRQQF